MTTYVYQCLECEKEYDVIQSMKDNKFIEYYCLSCNKKTPCKRLIVYSGPAIWKCGKPTINFSTRGYTGKFNNKLRPRGPVEAPNNKAEADKQFNAWVDSGGLDGIKPSLTIPTQTTEQQMDKTYKPKF